jgi:hypothetical protein
MTAFAVAEESAITEAESVCRVVVVSHRMRPVSLRAFEFQHADTS